MASRERSSSRTEQKDKFHEHGHVSTANKVPEPPTMCDGTSRNIPGGLGLLGRGISSSRHRNLEGGGGERTRLGGWMGNKGDGREQHPAVCKKRWAPGIIDLLERQSVDPAPPPCRLARLRVHELSARPNPAAAPSRGWTRRLTWKRFHRHSKGSQGVRASRRQGPLHSTEF